MRLIHFSVASSYANMDPNVCTDISYMHKIEHYVASKLPKDTTLDIPPVSEEFVLKQLSKLDVNKATGLDEISSYVLKIAAREIYQSVTHILNTSLQSNIFPSRWKDAKVIPIFKNNSTETGSIEL